MPGPDPFVVGDQPAVAERPDPVQVGDHLDPAADHRRVDRVVVGVQPDVVITCQPRRRRATPSPARPAATVSIAARSAVIRSVGAQPSARRRRVFTSASHCCSWALKSAGTANYRPGRNERSR